MSAIEALCAARAAGIAATRDGESLLLEAKTEPPQVLIDAIARHKPAILALLTTEPDTWTAAENERAAIMEHDGGIPRTWAEGLARLDPARPPADISPKRWLRFINDCGYFLAAGWATRAAEFGWGPLHLFGCDCERPFARVDNMGLIWFLNGGTITELHRDCAVIETRTEARQSYRRRPVEVGRVALPWELDGVNRRFSGAAQSDDASSVRDWCGTGNPPADPVHSCIAPAAPAGVRDERLPESARDWRRVFCNRRIYMSNGYMKTSVYPTIPAGLLAGIEKWLLSRVFKMEVDGDRLGFSAFWSMITFQEEEELLPDDELSKALAGSREICPDLCSSVEFEINASGVIMRSAVDYDKIFQSIVRRHPYFLRHISILQYHGDDKSFDGDEIFTLITADAIESIKTERTYEDGMFKNVQIVRSSDPHKPVKAAAPYILYSKRDFYGKR
jgi:hypothetical protein